jgi:signal transduction histidine kinase
MTADETYRLLGPIGFAIPTLVWGTLAWLAWRLLVVTRPESALFRILPIVTTLMAVRYGFEVLIPLVQGGIDGRFPDLRALLRVVAELVTVCTMPFFRHLVRLAPVREERPSRRWLLCNYGSAAAVSAVVVTMAIASPASMAVRDWLSPRGVEWAYTVAMCALLVGDMARLARRGAWSAGAAFEVRSADVLITAVALLATFVVAAVITSGMVRSSQRAAVLVVLHTVGGVAFALPFAARILGEVFRRVTVTLLTLAATAAIVTGGRSLGAHAGGTELGLLVDVGTVLALLFVLVTGRVWIRTAIGRAFSRDGQHVRETLQQFMGRVSPECGVLPYCEGVLTELTAVLRLRGAAVVLLDGRGARSHGAIPLAPLEAAWSGADFTRLPTRAFGSLWLADVARKEALIAARVTLVVPIVSPRRRWGHLFLSTGYLGVATRDEMVVTLEAFATQLGLVLDGAELLARAVAVERALGHAEKLAAIGEFAARVAHEIRNPVTAARSLAQLLCRDPTSPLNGEHAELILTELERVERQVQRLLSFARREELHVEPVNLADLVRATIEEFRPRLEAEHVAVTLDLPESAVTAADRERLRQVLVNLIENALDALADAPRARALALAVERRNGVIALDVADTGPGVAPEALPRLFEPFFSGKPSGTGLGLAIARRTVDAHGGRIDAHPGTPAGMRFRIELPLGQVP